jgi:hypothetical protein
VNNRVQILVCLKKKVIWTFLADKTLITEAWSIVMWITDCQEARYLAMARTSLFQRAKLPEMPNGNFRYVDKVDCFFLFHRPFLPSFFTSFLSSSLLPSLPLFFF